MAQSGVMPNPSWPESRQAPERLETLRRFLNTAFLEAGTDLLSSRESTNRWLKQEGFEADGEVGEDDVERLLDLRETIRGALSQESRISTDTMDWLFDTALHLDVRFTVIDGIPHAEGGDAHAPDRYATTLTLIASDSLRDRTWERLKTCANPVCRWAFYDHSKNGSGRWCSMDTCGARNKVRSYRARHGGGG